MGTTGTLRGGAPRGVQVAAPERAGTEVNRSEGGANRALPSTGVYVINLSSRPARLDAAEVRDGAARPAEPLLRLEGTTLDAAMRRFGVAPSDPDKRLLGGGQNAIVFVWVTVKQGLTAKVHCRRQAGCIDITHPAFAFVRDDDELAWPTESATRHPQGFRFPGHAASLSNARRMDTYSHALSALCGEVVQKMSALPAPAEPDWGWQAQGRAWRGRADRLHEQGRLCATGFWPAQGVRSWTS